MHFGWDLSKVTRFLSIQLYKFYFNYLSIICIEAIWTYKYKFPMFNDIISSPNTENSFSLKVNFNVSKSENEVISGHAG